VTTRTLVALGQIDQIVVRDNENPGIGVDVVLTEHAKSLADQGLLDFVGLGIDVGALGDRGQHERLVAFGCLNTRDHQHQHEQ